MDLDEKEKALKERLQRIKDLEKEIIERERDVKQKESAKKQVLLRLSQSLWNDLAEWADSDFRSLNGQIEFLLAEAVKKHKNKS